MDSTFAGGGARLHNGYWSPADSGSPGTKSTAPVFERSYSHPDTNQRSSFPRISRPVEAIRSSYDVVVIGSGYGGAVAASHMARGGQSVCVLERGKERWPGEYPVKLKDVVSELHISGSTRHPLKSRLCGTGKKTGLYNAVLGSGQNAFVGCGLGGTSLINANVFLPADHGTLSMPQWPEDIRKAPEVLDKYYERAAQMLQPSPYPLDHPRLSKLDLLERQAHILDCPDKFSRVGQTTRFRDGPNSAGVQMSASKLTGNDCTGLNDASKSSTLVTYLSDAWNWGAEMFCECEVRFIEKHPRNEGYLVFYAWHTSGQPQYKQSRYEDLMWVHAKKSVFFGAGSLGTTEILLRSKERGLPLSWRIGKQMSNNGDLLAFGYGMDAIVNGVGRENPSQSTKPVGPTIAGMIDLRDQKNPSEGFVIQEGAIPEAVAPLFGLYAELFRDRFSHSGLLWVPMKFVQRASSLIFGPYVRHGAMARTQTYLVMGHDSNQACLVLDDDKPQLTFHGVSRESHVKTLRDLLTRSIEAMGGAFVGSPFSNILGHEVTVHPIGGAVFSKNNSPETGAVNQFGELFTGEERDVHDGLVVVDASVIPTALGANPLATVTALAERSLEHAARKLEISVDLKTQNSVLDLFGMPSHPVKHPQEMGIEKLIKKFSPAAEFVSFAETMEGHVHIGNIPESKGIESYVLASRLARRQCEKAKLSLTVKNWSQETSTQTAVATGTFSCGSLPASPYLILRGRILLFASNPLRTETNNLIYDFDMKGIDGSIVHFHGFKIIDSSVALNPSKFWKATTTLYSELSRDGSVFGRGTLNISPRAFIDQALSFQPSSNLWAGTGAPKPIMNFLKYFINQSAPSFFTPFAPLDHAKKSHKGFLKSQSYTTIPLKGVDGVQSTLVSWGPYESSASSSNKMVLMVPGASVDHNIFAMPTLDYSVVDAFREDGYHVYSVTHRAGNCPEAQNNWTNYDARLDILASLKKIRQINGNQRVYILAHCTGSMALGAGLLDGTIPSSWVAGISASQVLLHPVLGRVNSIKAHFPIPIPGLYNLLSGPWYPCSTPEDPSFVQKALDQLLRFYPVGSASELCRSPSCHRGSLAFGRMWNHSNFNAATHDNIHQFFGGTSIRSMNHILAMGRAKRILKNPPNNPPLIQKVISKLTPGSVSRTLPSLLRPFSSSSPTPNTDAHEDDLELLTPSNISRLQNIPIYLFSGADNVVLDPQSTLLTYELLQKTFPADRELYERDVWEKRGHLDCWMSGRERNGGLWEKVVRHAGSSLDRVPQEM